MPRRPSGARTRPAGARRRPGASSRRPARNRSSHCRLEQLVRIVRAAVRVGIWAGGYLAGKSEGHDSAYRIVAESDAVESVGTLDRAAVVRYDDELGLVGQTAQGACESADVGLVERRVDFVKDAERNGPNLEHREQQA